MLGRNGLQQRDPKAEADRNKEERRQSSAAFARHTVLYLRGLVHTQAFEKEGGFLRECENSDGAGLVSPELQNVQPQLCGARRVLLAHTREPHLSDARVTYTSLSWRIAKSVRVEAQHTHFVRGFVVLSAWGANLHQAQAF